MANSGVNSHDSPLCSHKIASAQDDSRVLAEEALLSNGFQLSDTDEETPSFHSLYFNDLPSVTPITDSQDDDNRICAEDDALASEFELSNQLDSGVNAPSHDKANAVVSTQTTTTSSTRVTVGQYSAVKVEVQKNNQIGDDLQDDWALELQNIVAALEQHNSFKPEHGDFLFHILSSSNDPSADGEDFPTKIIRNLGNQYVDELPLIGDHKTATKTKPAEGPKKANPPVANHGGGIARDFNTELAQQNRDKHDHTLDGLDFIGGNEYRFNLNKQMAGLNDGEWGRGYDSFFASIGGYSRKRGASTLRGGSEGGHIPSSKSCSDLGFGRCLAFDASENMPSPPPPTDPKLVDALALARSMKFNPAEGRSSRGRSSAIHSNIGRGVGTTGATFAAAKTKAPSPKKTTKWSKQASFNKDTFARFVVKSEVVKTTFNNDWLSNASSTLAVKSFTGASSVAAPGKSNSAPRLSNTVHQISAESDTRDSSGGAALLVQRAYEAPLTVSLHSAQDWEDEHGRDIYDAPSCPQAQLISLSPVTRAASEGDLLDLRELQDEDNLDWMSMPVFQSGLPPSEAETSNVPASGVEMGDDANEPSLLVDFKSPSRVENQSSAPPSYRRCGSISGFIMPLSLMDQCFAMDEELSGGLGEEKAALVSIAADAIVPFVSRDGRIRYGRDELISMRHNTSPDLILDIVDSLPTIVCSLRIRARAHSRDASVVEQQQPPSSPAELATASVVEIASVVKKTPAFGELGGPKCASQERACSTAQKAPPSPSRTGVIAASVVAVVPVVKKGPGLRGLGSSKWASADEATSTTSEPQAKKDAGTSSENGSVEIGKIKKMGGLANSKYASPKKDLPQKSTHVSSRGQSTPKCPTGQSPAPGGSKGLNAAHRKSRVVDENTSAFPSRRKMGGGFGLDGGDDEYPSLPRRRSSSISPLKPPSRSEKNIDDEFQSAAGDAFVSPVIVSPARVPLLDYTNLHHNRSGAVHAPVEEFGRVRLGPAAPHFLPPPPPPVPAIPAMPAAFLPHSSQLLLLQGHAMITGDRGEIRRVRCAVRGAPWHDSATNTVRANIIVNDRNGVKSEMVGALHALPYDLHGNRWHADLFKAVEDFENEEEAIPVGPPRIDPDLEYSSQPVAAVYSWQSELEEPSLPKFVPGPNDNFGSPPIPIHSSVVPPSYLCPSLELPQTYIYPVPPPAANNLVHFHPVVDRSQAARAPHELFSGLVNSMSGVTLVAAAFPPANAERRYTFGTPLVPNFQNHPGYQNPQVRTHDGPNQQLFNHYVTHSQQPIPPQEEVDHYSTEFPQLQTQGNANQELFNRYMAQAQQPSPAQLSLQRMAELLGPPLQLTLRRQSVPGERGPGHPDGPPEPGTIFVNVPSSFSGRPALAPEDAYNHQPPISEDLTRRSRFDRFDGVFRRIPRTNAAIPIVDPNANCSSPASSTTKHSEEDKRRCGGREEEEKWR